MFIGQKEIATHTDRTKTGVTYITFADGSSDTMPTKLFNASCSPEPLDPTGLRDLQMRPIAGDILLVLYDWDIRWADYDFVDALVRASLQEHLAAATTKLWGKEKNDITIRDIDKIKHQ